MKLATWTGWKRWVVALACTMAPISPALAISEELERVSLAGLGGVAVQVAPMNADAERDGLTTSGLQIDVELKLRQSAIRVLNQTEAIATPGSPSLWLRVITTKKLRDVPLYGVAILLDLTQEVRLARNSTIILSAPTWSTALVTVSGTQALSQVRELVRDRVDEFINAYLAANPRR